MTQPALQAAADVRLAEQITHWPNEIAADPVSTWVLPWPSYVRTEEVPAALVLPPLLL